MSFQAAVLTMLDIGIRRGELCRLKVADWQASTGRLHIIQGKGDKNRYLFVGAKTQHMIWFYLEQRQPKRITEPLFITIQGKEFNHDYFRQKINQLGEEAGVKNCYPHRFRHTCALLRIKNGETAESLQHLLGHTTPKMAMYYVKLAALDLEEIQKNASPIDNLIY